MKRITHISFHKPAGASDPHVWLKQIDFFTGIPESQAAHNVVSSVHAFNTTSSFRKNGVDYEFVNVRFRFYPLEIIKTVNRTKPDILIVHGLIFPWQTWLLKKLIDNKRVRLFVQHHAERPLRHFGFWLQRLTDRVVEGYMFPAKGLASGWVQQKLISSFDKVHVALEGSSTFQPIDKVLARRHLQLPAGPIYLWVGRLVEGKDPITVVKSFQEFAATHNALLCMIYSDDKLLREVKAAVISERIRMVGKVPHDQLVPWYSAADFIVSASRSEGTSFSIVEAMSCGCIPILSRIDSFVEMISPNGILFETGNRQSLNAAFMQTIDTDIVKERQAVLDHFNSKLSFRAIAESINFTLAGFR